MSQATDPEGAAPDVQPPQGASPIETGPDQSPPNIPSADDTQAPPEAPAETVPTKARPPKPTVVVRYGAMRSIGEFRHNSKTPLVRGTKLVIRSERGVELGEVVAPVCDECSGLHLTGDKLKGFIRENGADYPFRRDGRVLRKANPQDVIDYRHLEQSAREAAKYCRQEIREMKLAMKLVAVEHLLGGERLVFYFSAEHRVDFRELVRKLASQYRTRIEMRQVGARDEARLVADYERCGRQCCCQSFLKDLRPVSMRMAKTQKATLDPSKISGRCGRLMCCLRYEDSTYEQLRKKLPRKNTWVRTEDGIMGRVVDTQIITQLVKVQLADSTFKAIANENIVERNLPAPPKPDTLARKPRRQPDRPIRRKRERLGAAVEAEVAARQESEVSQPGEQAETATANASDDSAGTDGQPRAGEESARTDSNGETTKKRRRRRRRKKGAKGQAQSTQASQATGQDQEVGGKQGTRQGNASGGESKAHAGEERGEKKKKPRRRRRRKKPGENPENKNRPAGDNPTA